MPADVRTNPYVATPLNHLKIMLILMFDDWKARARSFKIRKQLLNIATDQAMKEAHQLGEWLLTESGDFSAPGLICHAENKFAAS
jgi:hypothetical protein